MKLPYSSNEIGERLSSIADLTAQVNNLPELKTTLAQMNNEMPVLKNKIDKAIGADVGSVYAIGEMGTHCCDIKKAIRHIHISFDRKEGCRYYLTVVRRNHLSNDVRRSQLSIYRSDIDGDGFHECWTYIVSGDACTGDFYRLVEHGDVSVVINWANLSDGTGYTGMFNGYELDEMCWADQNPILLTSKIDAHTRVLETLRAEIDLFPFRLGSNIGDYVGLVRSSIRKLYLFERDDSRNYYLTVLRKNDSGVSQMRIYSRDRLNDSDSKLEFDLTITTPVSGRRIYKKSWGWVEIAWDVLEESVRYTGMFDGYELCDRCWEYSPADWEGVGVALNQFPDPHFSYGRYLLDVEEDFQIKVFGNADKTYVEDNCLVVSSRTTSWKGFQAVVCLNENWGERYNLQEGSEVLIGAYLKFEYGNSATVTKWGFYKGDPQYSVSSTPAHHLFEGEAPREYVWCEWRFRLGAANFNDQAQFSLGYLQVTDPDATAMRPTKIYVKQPCIVFYPNADYSGFSESVNPLKETCNNLEVRVMDVLQKLIFKRMESNDGDLYVDATSVDSRVSKAEYFELKDNCVLPSKGTFIGRIEDKIVLSVDGEIKEL